MKVGVVGGGFAGLSAAIAFRQNGHDVTVYERTATPSAEGGAISLAGNALACLAVLGIADRVVTQPYSRMPASVRTRDGRVLIRRSLAQLAGSDEIAVVPRAQLISWLTAALPSACLQYACDVNRVGVDGTVDVDGITHQFDLVVAADGLRSVARRMLWPGAPAPRATGMTGWSWTVDRELDRGFGVIWGGTTEFGILPLADGRTYVYGSTRSGQRDPRAFREWPQPLPALIDAAEPDQTTRVAVFEARPPRRVVHGRVALIGDAAHSMRPTLGQGAALAMEDGITLAYGGPARLIRRWPRMLALYGISKAGSRLSSPGGASLETARNWALRLLPDPMFGAMTGSVSRWRPREVPPVSG